MRAHAHPCRLPPAWVHATAAETRLPRPGIKLKFAGLKPRHLQPRLPTSQTRPSLCKHRKTKGARWDWIGARNLRSYLGYVSFVPIGPYHLPCFSLSPQILHPLVARPQTQFEVLSTRPQTHPPPSQTPQTLKMPYRPPLYHHPQPHVAFVVETFCEHCSHAALTLYLIQAEKTYQYRSQIMKFPISRRLRLRSQIRRRNQLS